MAQHRDLLAVAARAAEGAAELIRRAVPPDPAAWDRKAPGDFVTEVDRASERLIGHILTDAFPHSVVLGEELTPDAPREAGITWIVDPLDGTTNFLHGYPACAVSIAAVDDGEPVVGAVADVGRAVLYTATAGGGAWCGERRLRVSAVEDPAHALIGTGFPFKHPASERLDEYLAQFRRILPYSSGIRRAGSAALDLAHVAEGRLDGFWELWLAPWDVAAGLLLVREAGGVITDLAGTPGRAAPGGFVAGNAAVHRWLLERLAPEPPARPSTGARA
jgi:myo-inositol-1(or 4)-monophosphatase